MCQKVSVSEAWTSIETSGYRPSAVSCFNRLNASATGNLRFTANPLNQVTETIYDERGRARESVDNNGNSTLYTYTDANELETLQAAINLMGQNEVASRCT